MPQTWEIDDADAVCRLSMQFGMGLALDEVRIYVKLYQEIRPTTQLGKCIRLLTVTKTATNMIGNSPTISVLLICTSKFCRNLPSLLEF